MRSFYRHKLEGFTILEVIVALLLGSIVIAMASWVFLTVSSNFQRFTSIYSYNSHILQFRFVFSNDLERAKEVYFEGDVLRMIFSDTITIEYDFHSQKIIRTTHEVLDTFQIDCDELQVETESLLVKWVSFNINLMDTTWEKLEFYKTYPELLKPSTYKR